MSDQFEVRVTGLDGLLAVLQSLPSEVVSAKGGPVRKALAKAARKFRTSARANLKAAIAEGGARSTGMTAKSLIVKRAKGGTGHGERYHVTIKGKSYKNADGVDTDTRMTANLLEWGSVHQPATPWLRKTAQELGQGFIESTGEDLRKQVEVLAESLSRKNGVPK